MTVDGSGKLLCADQYGKIYRVTPATKPDQETVVIPTAIPLGGAHALLWHQGVLWVTVNEGPEPAGVYRVTDSDRDGEPDKAVAAEGVRSHISRFWEPRMRREIIAHLQKGGAGLSATARTAIEKLAPVT